MTMTMTVPTRVSWDLRLAHLREQAAKTLRRHWPCCGRCSACGEQLPCTAARAAELVLEL
jgi:hypothetical protein